MKFFRVPLSDESDKVYLDAYIADKIAGFTRKAIVVIPGGGYTQVCSDREGEPIAMAFMPHGFNAFVLHYSVDGATFPTQLIELSRAIKYVKDNALELDIDPEKVFTVGFSAGGHLSASAGVLWKNSEVQAAIDAPYGYTKPKGTMLIYPVINGDYHRYSFAHLLGKPDFDECEKNKVSIDRNIDSDSAPAFILHTVNDKVVDVRNSIEASHAYADAGVPFEMHIYPDSPHGVALGNEITGSNPEWIRPNIAEWIRMAAYWADNLK